jgi:N-carbamoylputrescine amidase
MNKQFNFRVAAVQERCVSSREDNIERAISRIREAASNGAQLICLSELFAGPYFCTTQSLEFFETAEPIPGPTVERFQPLAKGLGCVLILPIFERRAAGVYHNSAVVLDADGSIAGVYRKMHIPDDPLYFEKYYFTPGDSSGSGHGFHAIQTRYAKVGVLICWDQWYPEAARLMALDGAEVIFYPTAIGWHPAEKAEFGAAQVDAWQTIQRAHAIANGVYVVSVNRCGFEATPGTAGLEFFGSSFIADPFGRRLAEASSAETAVLTADCSREVIEDVRRNWPFLRDRRIDAYGEITKRFR